MGEFLSTPDKTKESFDNENEYLRFGSCGMQGWRKRMEDAHISDISQGENKQYQIFGVFDGHGGKEVSQFVKAHFTKEFLNNQNLKAGDVKKALTETFFKSDEIIPLSISLIVSISYSPFSSSTNTSIPSANSDSITRTPLSVSTSAN